MGRRRAAAMLAKHEIVSRPRGGASHACPVCGSKSEVLDTRREEDGPGVVRARRCLKKTCRHKFDTREKAR